MIAVGIRTFNSLMFPQISFSIFFEEGNKVINDFLRGISALMTTKSIFVFDYFSNLISCLIQSRNFLIILVIF